MNYDAWEPITDYYPTLYYIVDFTKGLIESQYVFFGLQKEYEDYLQLNNLVELTPHADENYWNIYEKGQAPSTKLQVFTCNPDSNGLSRYNKMQVQYAMFRLYGTVCITDITFTNDRDYQ